MIGLVQNFVFMIKFLKSLLAGGLQGVCTILCFSRKLNI